jgi:hypothetical protein
MTGDTARNDDQDFLADDFVVEDLAGPHDDLDNLFEAPEGGAAAAPVAVPVAASDGPSDADDVLFTDHTTSIAPDERFAGPANFAENAGPTWNGEQLDLDAEAALTAASEARASEPAPLEAAMSRNEAEELAIDSDHDAEIELVDGPPPEAVADAEAEAPPELVGEGDQDAAAGEPTEAESIAEGIWDAVEAPVMAESADESAEQEPGWEPLPGANVDALAEVAEIAPVAAEVDGAEPVATDPAELAEVEGHDIYAPETETPVLVGPAPTRRRSNRAASAVGVLFTMAAAAAVVVLRPEWIGLRLEPQRVQEIRIERPHVRVALAPPPVVPLVVPKPEPPPAVVVLPPPVAAPDTVPIAAVPTYDVPFGPELPPESPPLAQAVPPGVVPVLAPETTLPVVSVATDAPSRQKRLVRVGDNLMIGDAVQTAAGSLAVDGVMPGMRAFAQLRNGNYFIGSVKSVAPEHVTLRLDVGEITIDASEIARVTQLGSSDYEALQKVTEGSVRLTNNNRLVGSILSQIADDHVVLEFRSNRVMLPKALVGELMRGDAAQSVRLDLTREEDDWVKALAEREIGAGAPAALPARSKAAPVPPAPPASGRSQ